MQNAFSLANSFGFSSDANISYVETEASTTTEAVTRALRARGPRRRTQLSRGRDIEEVTRDYVSSEVPRENLRTRARLPRRRVNVNRDLERNERNALVSGFSVVTIYFSNEN